MQALDISAAMRSPPSWQTPDGQAAFWLGDAFNGGASWVGCFSGTSPWERHPDGEELLHVLEGEVEITVLAQKGSLRRRIKAGAMFVVPRGLWHKQRAIGSVVECGATSGRSQH